MDLLQTQIRFTDGPFGRWLQDGFDSYAILWPNEAAMAKMQYKSTRRKPDNVSWGDVIGPVWFEGHPSGLKKRHRLACLLDVGGVRKYEIARKIGMSETRLNILLSSSACRRYSCILHQRHARVFGVNHGPYEILRRRLAKWGVTDCQFNLRKFAAGKTYFGYQRS